ncbi:MAG: hypothetical protein ACK6D7_20315, partial [Acidobacteriota bacterium]
MGYVDTKERDAAVAGDHRVRIAKDAFDVLFGDGVVDAGAAALFLKLNGRFGGVGEVDFPAPGAGDVGEGLAGEGALGGATGYDDVFGFAGAAVGFDGGCDFGAHSGALAGR